MDPRATKDERRVALLRAKEHGLDLVEVAKLTVNLVMNDTFMVRHSPVRLHACAPSPRANFPPAISSSR